MRTSVSSSKGILLEQNKEPALSREIRVLEQTKLSRQLLSRPVCSTPELLAPHEIVTIAKEARIVDESDGVRLWKKLAQAARESIHAIVVDAIDDEPYISSQLGPALQMPEELSQGIMLAKRSVGAATVHIEIYKNLLDVDVKIPGSIGGIKVERVGGTYPAESRARATLTGKNALVIGAGAVLSLRRAVFEGYAQTTCYVTVAGDCVANPANYEVPIGMAVSEVIDAAGLIAEPRRLVAGGSMTGYALTDPQKVSIGPTTRGVLAFASEFRDLGFSCIGCGRCAEVCPQGLSPYYIYRVMRTRRKRNLELFDADLCTGCGTCSYACPAKLDLAQMVLSCGAQNAKRIADEPQQIGGSH